MLGKKRKPFTEEAKINMSLGQRGCKKPPRSFEHLKNLSKAARRKRGPYSEQRKQNISKACLGKKKNKVKNKANLKMEFEVYF